MVKPQIWPEETGEAGASQEGLLHLGRLAAAAGHELRNPLAVIHNAVYLLRARPGLADDPRGREYLDLIGEELACARRIIDDLLGGARVRPPRRAAVPLEDLLARVLADVPLPPGIRWQYCPEQAPVILQADPGQLRQVLRNLLANAVQAIGGEGVVRLRACTREGRQQLLLSDSGEGVDPAHHARLFEPLFSTRTAGNGLGLWVARELVRRHGGELSLVEGELAGAGFLLSLPSAEAATADSAGISEPFPELLPEPLSEE